MALTLVEEGDAIVGEERLELHGLRSATAARRPLPSSSRSRRGGFCRWVDLARIRKGFPLEDEFLVVRGGGRAGFLLRHSWAFFRLNLPWA